MVGGVGTAVVGFIAWVISVFRGFLSPRMHPIFEWPPRAVESFLAGL